MPVHQPRTRYRGSIETGSAVLGTYRFTDSFGTLEEGELSPDNINLFSKCLGFGGTYEFMRDRKNSRDVTGDLPVSEVSHFKLKGSGLGQVTIHTPNFLGFGNWSQTLELNFAHSVYMGDNPLEAFELDRRRWIPDADAAVVKTFGLDAWAFLNAQFPEEISIANFLFELREVPGMILGLVGRLRSLASSHAGAINPAALAGDYLSWEFGWLPLLDDIITLFGITARIEKRIKHLLDTYGRPVKAGFHRVIEEFEGREVVGFDMTVRSFDNWARVRPVAVKRKRVMRAGARIFHELSWLRSWHGQLRAILGTLGLTNPGKVFWNAAPFSFILDWFFGVSSHLAAFANFQQIPDWAVDRLTSSMTTTQECVFGVWDSNGVYLYDVPGAKLTAYHYWRLPTLPFWMGHDLVIATPTTKQLALSAALIAGSSRT